MIDDASPATEIEFVTPAEFETATYLAEMLLALEETQQRATQRSKKITGESALKNATDFAESFIGHFRSCRPGGSETNRCICEAEGKLRDLLLSSDRLTARQFKRRIQSARMDAVRIVATWIASLAAEVEKTTGRPWHTWIELAESINEGSIPIRGHDGRLNRLHRICNMLGAVANHIAIHFDDAPDIPTGSASNEGTILVTRTAQETSLTKQQEDDVARNEIARRHAKMFQGLGDKFTELAGRAETAKMSHLEHDFGAALLQAATLLNAAADAGLLPDWERERSWILNTTGPFAHVIEGFLGTPGHERTCRLWTFAIQRQIKKHPGLFHPDASQLDWQHVRIDASVAPIITYFAASELRSMAPGRREALRIWTAKLRAKGILPPGRRVFKEWSRPPDAFVEDESALGEPDGDEADQRHRIKLRAEACSTACGLFRDQIVVASPPGASAGAMNGTDPIDDHRNTIREGEAIPLESDATPIMKTDGAPNGGEAELTESDAKLKLWNSLTDRQRNCMIALRELKALDAESLQDASKIAVKAEGSQQNRSGFKVPLSDLVHRKLAASKLGWKGGYWLTRRGDELLSAVTHD